MSNRHYSRELDPYGASLIGTDAVSGFTYATFARVNLRPALLYDQTATSDPAAIWEVMAPREKLDDFPIFLKMLFFPQWTGDAPSGWQAQLHLGVEVVKPGSAQSMLTTSYFPSDMLVAPAFTSAGGAGELVSFDYQFPDDQIASIAQDDLLRIFIGLKRGGSSSGLRLYLAGATIYDEYMPGY